MTKLEQKPELKCSTRYPCHSFLIKILDFGHRDVEISARFSCFQGQQFRDSKGVHLISSVHGHSRCKGDA